MSETKSALDAYQAEKSTAEIIFDRFRYLMSTLAILASVCLICYALGKGFASFPGHPAIHYPLLLFVLILLAYLEGLQVAILALERVDRTSFSDRKKSFASHKLATADRGRNVQRFLVGRQFFVVFVVFVAAQLTTYTQMREEMKDIPKFVFILIIETGFPGALIVLAFGQLIPQHIAATHPITFMGLPGAWCVIQLCLVFESFGVTLFSSMLTATTRLVFGMSPKENVKITVKQKTQPRMIDLTECNKEKCRDIGQHLTTENLSVEIKNADKLITGAVDGLQYASYATLAEREVINWLKYDSISRNYSTGKSDKYPMPPTIVRHLIQNGKSVPRYLLPPYHRLHIAPHIIAFELLRREEHRMKEFQIEDTLDEMDEVFDQTQHTA